MDPELKIVTAALLDAASSVPAAYMEMPIAGQQSPAYRERVYCYELYHQWSSRWPAETGFSLAGEVDKTNHPLIPGSAKPDFLVHVPGEMRNLLVMEVKPASAKLSRIVKDLETLRQFTKELGDGRNYFAAYLFFFGLDDETWLGLRERLRPSMDTLGLGEHDVVVVRHQRAGEGALVAPW